MKPFTKGLLLLAGFAVPTAVAALFVFGCCVLPFHKSLHEVMPLCHVASGILSGHHDGDDHADHHPAPPAPAREKLSAAPLLAESSVTSHFVVTNPSVRQEHASVQSDVRSFISQGAVRCESDVGLHLLNTSFLI